MADEHEVRRINWTEVFSFTQIFKSFRMAMHLSKLALALAIIVLVYCFGRVMDGFWGLGNSYAFPDEIAQYTAKGGGFAAWRDQRLAARMSPRTEDSSWSAPCFYSEVTSQVWYSRYLTNLAKMYSGLTEDDLNAGKGGDDVKAMGKTFSKKFEEITKDQKAQSPADVLKKAKDEKTSWAGLLSQADSLFEHQCDKIKSTFDGMKDQLKNYVEKESGLNDATKTDVLGKLEKAPEYFRPALTRTKVQYYTERRAIQGDGIFASFSSYEAACVGSAIQAVCRADFTGGLTEFQRYASGGSVAPAAVPSGAEFPAQLTAAAAPRSFGVFYWVLMGFSGLAWLITQHWVYALISLAFFLAVWAVLGGAIHRIAALHAAREEKISIMQALGFSISKIGSFITAPLLPLAIILFIGLGMSLVSLFGAIPYVGEVVLGLLFFLALLGGLAMAFLAIGWFFGGALMYPTIAVEGSDSFDAISRSFSYVLSRPWRSALYGLAALVYGAITYLFVRLFIYVAMITVHAFVRLGVFTGGGGLSPNADKLDVIWAKPSFNSLWGTFNWQAMDATEKFAAFCIGVFTFLLAAVVVAYLISFFCSSSTIIYLLLRRKVDATDMDDVYVEEPQEPVPPMPTETPAAPTGEPAPTPAPAPETAPTPAPAEGGSAPEPSTPPAPPAPTDAPPTTPPAQT